MNEGELTSRQIRQAKRFAWHGSGLVFAYGKMYSLDVDLIIANAMSRSPGAQLQTDVRIVGARPFGDLIGSYDSGWHHLSGCDCEFCPPTQPVIHSRPPCSLDDEG